MTALDDRPAVDAWEITTADEVLPWDATREDWLGVRRDGLGGSDVSALMGMTKWGSPTALWLDKTGRYVDDSDSLAAYFGRKFEAGIAEYFTEETGVETRRCGLLRSRAHPVMQCTPDRLVPHGGLEIKTLDFHTEHLWADDQTPDHAELQAQWCMAVSGRRHWWVLGLAAGRRPYLRYLERDDELIGDLVAEAERWWAAYVVADEMPPLDGSDATGDALQGWIGAADPDTVIGIPDGLLDDYAELAAAKEVADAAAADVAVIEARIRLAVGQASVVAIDPAKPVDETAAGKRNTLLTLRNDGPFSGKKFAAANPELVAQFTRPVPALDGKAIAAAHPDLHRSCRARVIRPRKAQLAALLAARTTGEK